jgi:hypothetical protein
MTIVADSAGASSRRRCANRSRVSGASARSRLASSAMAYGPARKSSPSCVPTASVRTRAGTSRTRLPASVRSTHHDPCPDRSDRLSDLWPRRLYGPRRQRCHVRSLLRLHANARVHLHADPRDLAGEQRERPPGARATPRGGRHAQAHQKWRPALSAPLNVAGPKPPRRTNDLDPWSSDADPGSVCRRRRLDRAARHRLLQPVSSATDPAWTGESGDTLARTRRLCLSRRPGSHRRVARSSRATARRKDQPRARPRRAPGHRQGHAPGTGQSRHRSVELRRRLPEPPAWPLQRLRQVGHPAYL